MSGFSSSHKVLVIVRFGYSPKSPTADILKLTSPLKRWPAMVFILCWLPTNSSAHFSATGRQANAKQPCRGKDSENEFIKSVLFSPEHNLQSNMLHCHYLITVISTLAPVNLLKNILNHFLLCRHNKPSHYPNMDWCQVIWQGMWRKKGTQVGKSQALREACP